jgi:hypothetical protein
VQLLLLRTGDCHSEGSMRHPESRSDD